MDESASELLEPKPYYYFTIALSNILGKRLPPPKKKTQNNASREEQSWKTDNTQL